MAASRGCVPSVSDRKKRLGLAQEETVPLSGFGRPFVGEVDSVGCVDEVISSSSCMLVPHLIDRRTPLAERVAVDPLPYP